MSISIPVIYNIKKKINKNTDIEIHSLYFIPFVPNFSSSIAKGATIEFVFGFGNAKNLLLLLKSYLSEFDILNFSAIFFGQFPVIAFETYALAFSFLFRNRFLTVTQIYHIPLSNSNGLL